MEKIRLIALMVLGTATGGVLCFFNGLFKRPYLYLRNIAVGGVCGLYLAVTAGILLKQRLSDLSWIISVMEIVLPVILAYLTVYLGMLKEKHHEMVSMVLSGPAAFCIMRMFFSTSLSHTIWISVGISVFLLGLGFFCTRRYFSFECSIIGGYLISWLYCGFFSLEQKWFYTIFSAITAIGTMLGILVRKNN